MIIPSSFDSAFAIPYKTYKVYIDSPPSYAPSGTYQAVIDALNFWEKRDNINFDFVEEGYQDIYIKWAKNLDERHVGYAFAQKLIEVGLGDDYCRDTWNPFHIDYIRNILTHEVGHVIGYSHEQYPDSIMNSGGRSDKHYGLLEFEETVGEYWNWRFQVCNFDDIANISYSVESNSDAGVRILFLPSYEDVQNAIDEKPYSRYIQGKCGDDNFYVRYGGTCSVRNDAWVFIKNGNKVATITLKMMEVDIPEKYYKVYAANKHDLPVSISVWTDKTTYQNGDIIKITGKVNNFRANSDTTYYVMGISVGVVMSELPGGKLTLNSRGEFTTSFVADFPLFGEYRVGVSHSGAKDGSISINYINSPVSIFLSTDKGTYLAGDTIEVKGKVQNYKKGYTTFLKMNDPSNNVLAGTDIQLDDRGKFSYSVSLDKHKHRMDSGGSYSLTLTHAGMSEKTYFSYIPPETKQSSPIIQQGDVQDKVKLSYFLILDSFDNPTTNFAVGEEIKVSFVIKNLQYRAQSYEYLAELLDKESGNTITLWSRPIEQTANGAKRLLTSFSIDKPGEKLIKVSILESADNPTLLAPPLEKGIYIQDNEPVQKIESSSKHKINCLPGRELVDSVCRIIQTNEPRENKFCFLFWCWNF